MEAINIEVCVRCGEDFVIPIYALGDNSIPPELCDTCEDEFQSELLKDN